ncbi:MAG: DUF1549 domain-containing protein, partial [Opitutales bacterium]
MSAFRPFPASILVIVGLVPLVSFPAEKHWAFEAPKKPSVPKVARADWPRNEIDRFILAKLEKEGIAPSRESSPATLVRRLHLDLSGLPPTPERAKAFVEASSGKSYEALVDELLISPHYGERMAQDWFDLARFADTSGYAADRTRNIWPYRDWVIRAFNENMSYKQFSIEQLAGDLITEATDEQKVASAFHRHAMQAKGNNPRKEEFRVKGIVDRLETTGRTWLGLTIECAECHDHKHDPVSQKEYYQLFAIFNNVPHLGSGYGVHGPRMKYAPRFARLEQERLTAKLVELRATAGEDGKSDPVPLEGLVGEWQKAAHVEDASKYSLTGSLTITAEIETTAKIGDILSKYDWEGSQRGFVFGIGGEGDAKARPGRLFAWVSAEAARFSGVTAYGSIPVNDGRPHQVAFVFEAGRSVRLYVDGIEDKGAKVEGYLPKTIAQSKRGLSVGMGYKKSATPNAHKFVGHLSKVRLYEHSLANALGADADKSELAEYRRVAER